MIEVSIIIPTITGREDSLERAVNAYHERSTGYQLEFIVEKDFPTWPAGCNAGIKRASGSILHFTADDLEPLDGWADAMYKSLLEGYVPNPRLWNGVKSGPPVYEQFDGPPGAIARLSRIPSLPRRLVESMGEWPEAIHYYSDNWVTDKASLLGWLTRTTEGYDFLHHWHSVGRLDGGDWRGRYLPLYNAERAKLGLDPVPF